MLFVNIDIHNSTIAQLQEQIERLRSAARIPQNEILPQLGSDQLLTDSRSQEYEEDISLSQPPPVIPSPQPGPSGMSTWAEQSRSDEPEILSPLASAKYSFLDGSHVSLLETGDRASLARKLGEVSINGEEVNQLFRMYGLIKTFARYLLISADFLYIITLFLAFWTRPCPLITTTTALIFYSGP